MSTPAAEHSAQVALQAEPSLLLSGIVLLPLLGAVVLGALSLFRNRSDQGVSEKALGILACLGPGLATLLALYFFIQSQARGEVYFQQTLWTWIQTSDFRLNLAFGMDRLNAMMALMITFIGTLIHIFSIGYMHGDKGFIRYFAYLNLFLSAMLMLILSDNLVGMFLGWEGVGVCSYLLIGFWFSDPEKTAAGTKAFIVNRIGDFGFLLGIFLIFIEFQSFEYIQIQARLSEVPAESLTMIALLLFIGAMGKSAQIPLHVWLPDAMAGPTPVSALIHAATMVTAGVYMVARLHFIYHAAPSISWLIILIGALTALMAATIALVQEDIKKVLAYSTVSQLGYMFMAVGAGAYAAGIFHVFTHAFFKAALFLGAGAIIHCLHHEQNLAKMGGLRSKLKITHGVMLVATLAIAGIPPLAGFFSKDEVLWSLWQGEHYVFWGMGLMTAGLTAFYMFRLYFLAFAGDYRGQHEVGSESPLMNGPLVCLALGAALTGFLGLPDVLLAQSNIFAHWLSPVLGQHESSGNASQALMLMGASVLVAVVGIGLAYLKYGKGEVPAAQDNLLIRVLKAKYGFDLFYQRYIVRPLLQLAWFSWKIIDELMLDGPFKALPGVYRITALCVRTLQFGRVRAYGYYLLLGLMILLYTYYLLHPGALFL